MSTLLEELNKNKVIEDAVQPNKMSKFAYTEKAYNDNDAAGVDSFNFEAEQNIPSDKISVLQTNETVILKGFRAQASVVPRMLFDHFFGRASYNLNKVHDVVKGVLDAFVNFIGKANGIATLDENGRIPYSQLPESAMEFKGTWNASTNTPTLADGTGDTGDFYVVSVAGTQNLGSGEIKFLENDRVIYSDGVWSKLSAGDVRTVNTIQPTDGNVTITGDDINLSGSDTTKVATKVTSHIEATTGVHGAVSTATANKIAIRDASGRLQVATPSAANDAANKSYVDSKSTGDAGAVQTALNAHTGATTGVHGATSAPTANKIAIRDGSGRLQVANPSTANDAVNKSYFDTALGKLGTLIEKRVIRESGNVSIPAGTKWIFYVGIGGGGGGAYGMSTVGGGGGSGGAGAGGGAGGTGGTQGAKGGNGKSGIIYNTTNTRLKAVIGKGGKAGNSSGTSPTTGGDTFFTVENTDNLDVVLDFHSSKFKEGNKGYDGQYDTGGLGAPNTEILNVIAGGGGNGAGGGSSSTNPTDGDDGALIAFFYS